MIIIIDFGSQTTHLISRRFEDLGIKTKIVDPSESNFIIKNDHQISGIVLSGGPSSVYDDKSPKIKKKVLNLKIPVLGICYGMQLTANLLDGKVSPGESKEFGPATLVVNESSQLLKSLSPHSQVWMSHGDYVSKLPTGFEFIAQTKDISAAAMSDEKKKIFGVQFHPEVEHTEHGEIILKNFAKICGLEISKTKIDIPKMIANIKKEIGDYKAAAAVSGGLDSTVAATLVAKAIGNNLIPIHVDSGLMRPGTTERVTNFFQNLGIKPIIIEAEKIFLEKLKDVTDPEQKRKIIGKLYIDLFDEAVKDIEDVKYLVQGTIYSDVIESKGSKHSDNIKSHHNVGGLPDDMKLELVEPIRQYYTDQVRHIAKKIGVPDEITNDQPHPGPGYAIRIVGPPITKKRLEMITKADTIIIEEMKAAGWYEKVLHSYAIMTGAMSTAVKGDQRCYGEVVAIRILESSDRMTAIWTRLPYELLQKMSSRIINEIAEVSRVVYDISSKPPATMEWE